MSDERIDLSALDPAADARRWEALIARTMAAASPEPAWWSVRHLRVAALSLAAIALLSWVPALLSEPAPAADAATSLYSGAGDVMTLVETVDGW